MIGDSRRLEGDRETIGGKARRREREKEAKKRERRTEGAKKNERAASILAITTEIEMLGEMKLKICDERQSERGGERRGE